MTAAPAASPPRDVPADDPGWPLEPSPKYAGHGVVRVVPPAETVRRVTPLMDVVGVTRVAEVTGLDRVGIPNYTSVRPRERGPGISYYNGKGTTRSAAHAGALMEAVERYSAECCDLPVRVATAAELRASGPVVDPAGLVVPPVAGYDPDRPLEWVTGTDLLSGEPTAVPLGAVVCPYEPPPGLPVVHAAHTNGLASGNTREEALCHALCELVERDAAALADAVLDLAPAAARLLGTAEALRPPTQFPLVDLETLPRRALVLVRRLERAGLRVYLRDVTCTAGVPALSCAIVEPHPGGEYLAHGGAGAHPDARVAVCRALTEAAQSRVGHIQGGREDLPGMVGPPRSFEPAEVFGRGPVVPFGALPSRENAGIDDDVRDVLRGLRRDGFGQVVALDLTRPEVGVPVVRVVVPGIEAWSVFYSHTRRSLLGPRANAALVAALRGEAVPCRT